MILASAVFSGIISFVHFLRTSAKKRIHFEDDTDSEISRRQAKVVTRKSTPHPFGQMKMLNSVVFELLSGERIEIEIKDRDAFETIVEGEIGFLLYKGEKIVCFEKE